MLKAYIKWSLHQLFLLYFQPSRFAHEVEGSKSNQPHLTWQERFPYLLKILPCVLVFTLVENLITGYICELFGINFRWLASWSYMVAGIGLIMMISTAFSLRFGLALLMTVGVAASIGVNIGYGAGFGVFGVAVGIYVGGPEAEDDVWTTIKACAMGGLTICVALSFHMGGKSLSVDGLIACLVFFVSSMLTSFRLYAYPFDCALAVCVWVLRRYSWQGFQCTWKLYPLFWNEAIWLPLPNVSELLTLLAREDREEGMRQIAFVAVERPRMRHNALAAIQEIALDDLRVHTLPELEAAPDRLQWAADAPLSMPEAFQTALPRFLRVAQHVGQFRTLYNAHRRNEALGRAVKEVQGLQTALIGTRGRFARRLLQTANSWNEVLERERTVLTAQIEAAHEIYNPFVFGSPVGEAQQNVFMGRQDIAAQIERSILGTSHPPTLLLHGPRRMGKTSLLYHLPRMLGNQFAPAILDCQNPATTESASTLLRYFSRTLCDGLKRRQITFAPLTAAQLEREPFAAFDDWLNEMEQALPPDMRALLCLDEYERLQDALDAGWGGKFLDMLRHTLQHRPRVVLMFTGAHTFAELGPAWTDRFISARRMRVSFLPPNEVRQLLTPSDPRFDMTYAEGALEAVLKHTIGQPYLTQAVAYELVEHLNQQQRKQATCADVDAAIIAAFSSGDVYFANVWSDAGAEGQAILYAVARNDTLPDYPQARTWLRDHDVLTAQDTFAVPMLERWVREYK